MAKRQRRDSDDGQPLYVKLFTKKAKVPLRISDGAAGYDLYSLRDVTLKHGAVEMVDTGVGLAIPDGYYGRIAPRSSLAVQGIQVLGGVIDSDYRGPIRVILTPLTDKPYVIKEGDRIAQIIIEKCASLDVAIVRDLPATKRGSDGFGSSGR